MLFHISDPIEWADAQAAGESRWSTRGLRLDEVGFVHLCTETQVAGVLERFYVGVPDLVLLHVDETLLTDELKWEPAPDSGELFPHLYGPLPASAVVEVTPVVA
jgi:glutathione S-transferase